MWTCWTLLRMCWLTFQAFALRQSNWGDMGKERVTSHLYALTHIPSILLTKGQWPKRQPTYSSLRQSMFSSQKILEISNFLRCDLGQQPSYFQDSSLLSHSAFWIYKTSGLFLTDTNLGDIDCTGCRHSVAFQAVPISESLLGGFQFISHNTSLEIRQRLWLHAPQFWEKNNWHS